MVLSSVVLREKKSNIKCLECGKVLHSTLHYTRHINFQHSKTEEDGTRIKLCYYCNFKGKPSTVNQHISRTHYEHRSNFCLACGSNFHSKYDLHKHYSTKKHIESTLEQLVSKVGVTDITAATSSKDSMRCTYCAFTTNELRLLQTHYTSNHGDESAEDRVLLHTGTSVTQTYCRFCKLQVTEPRDLYIHEVQHVLVTNTL